MERRAYNEDMERQPTTKLISSMEEIDDEILAETVGGYPVLYDKTHNEFHRKHVKENACAKVAEELGVEKSEAEKAFKKLRDRFVRARRELAKEDQSVTSARKISARRRKSRHCNIWNGLILTRRGGNQIRTCRL